MRNFMGGGGGDRQVKCQRVIEQGSTKIEILAWPLGNLHLPMGQVISAIRACPMGKSASPEYWTWLLLRPVEVGVSGGWMVHVVGDYKIVESWYCTTNIKVPGHCGFSLCVTCHHKHRPTPGWRVLTPKKYYIVAQGLMFQSLIRKVLGQY